MKKIMYFSLFMGFLSLMSFQEIASSDSKFWGTLLSWGACGPGSSGDGKCYQGQYSQYFVFWIATSKLEPTGKQQECNCDQSGTAPQNNTIQNIAK